MLNASRQTTPSNPGYLISGSYVLYAPIPEAMDSHLGSNAVATFLRLSRPINFSPIPVAAALSNIQLAPRYDHRTAALCTGLLATGLALSTSYAGIFDGGEHEQKITNSVPIKWLGRILVFISPDVNLRNLSHRLSRRLCPASDGPFR